MLLFVLRGGEFVGLLEPTNALLTDFACGCRSEVLVDRSAVPVDVVSSGGGATHVQCKTSVWQPIVLVVRSVFTAAAYETQPPFP